VSWLVDPATRALTTALDGYARRELAIASNLANIDTPGYKPVAVDFESELALAASEAIAGAGGQAMNPPTSGQPASFGLERTSEAHLAGLEAGSAAGGSSASQVAASMQNRVDGNAVDVDAQMTSLAETQLKYSATSRMLTGKLQMLKDVVSAR
jgi:flagellar basal-body rod protein FlgB